MVYGTALTLLGSTEDTNPGAVLDCLQGRPHTGAEDHTQLASAAGFRPQPPDYSVGGQCPGTAGICRRTHPLLGVRGPLVVIIRAQRERRHYLHYMGILNFRSVFVGQRQGRRRWMVTSSGPGPS